MQAAEAPLRRDVSRFEVDAAKARATAARKRENASRNKSESSRRSYFRSAENEDKKVVAAEKKIDDLKRKLGDNAKAQATVIGRLAASEKSERQTVDRANERCLRTEKDHAREVARLSRPTVRYVVVSPPKPERLRVLYLTANPEAVERRTTTPDGTVHQENRWLRT